MNKVFKNLFVFCIVAGLLFVSINLSFASDKIIKKIDVQGNKSISTSMIVSKIKSRVGSVYFENIVDDDVKRLYKEGYFDDIKIDVEDYEDGLRLVINVKERLILERIDFKGNRYIRNSRIRKDLKSKEGQYVNYSDIMEDIDMVKSLYEKKGFSLVDISYTEDINKDAGKVIVTVNIQEKRRHKIRSLNFSGNDSFSSKRLMKLIKTRKAAFFSSGVFKEDVFLQDQERLRAFYMNEGFSDVSVDSEIEYGALDSIYLTFQIKEGPRYNVKKVDFSGNKVFTERELRLTLENCLEGAVYNEDGLRKDQALIKELYFDDGYIAVKVDYDVFADLETNGVNITYNIVENEISYVNLVKVRGNVKTKDIVIRREMRLKPGDKFDGEKLRRSKERLKNLGFFDEQEGVNYDIEDTNVANKKNLVVELKEAKTGEFSFGGGYSTVDKMVGFVQIEQKNFDWRNWPYFTGDGQDLRLRAELGSISDEYMLSFTEPWIFDYPVSFGFDLYRSAHDRDTDVGYSFDETRTGGDLRLGKALGEYLSASAVYRLDNIEITNIDDAVVSDIKKEEGENDISSMKFGLGYDTRDNVFSPTKGNIFGITLECAGGPFGGDKDFTKVITRYSHFFPFMRKSTFETRFYAGVANEFDSADDVPIYERFYAGGANTIRGYEERKVGPIDSVTEDPIGGKAIFIANFEYLYPVVDQIKLATFYDVGNVWKKSNDIFNGGDLKSSVGLGLRIKTPIGPVKLDYGIPLKTGPGEEGKGGRFHFSAGQTF
ncbi:MAG: outer membrane protein assembly factor BamA [Candidatus Gygaella obscura]|nr:outer membrane protein assembly factor BamA [Candidatus Gygaella obscura]